MLFKGRITFNYAAIYSSKIEKKLSSDSGRNMRKKMKPGRFILFTIYYTLTAKVLRTGIENRCSIKFFQRLIQ